MDCYQKYHIMIIRFHRCAMTVVVGVGAYVSPLGGWGQEVEKMPMGVSSQQRSEGDTVLLNEHSAINAKLQGIVIPSLVMENESLEECINRLRIRAAEHDGGTDVPEEAGVEIEIRYPRQLNAEALALRVSSLKLKDVALGAALQSICDAVGYRYHVESSGVILEPAAPLPGIVAGASSSNGSNLPNSSPAAFASSELSKILTPLIRPDVNSAKMVLTSLQQLSERSSGAEKVAMLQVAAVIRNVITAEFLVNTKVKGRNDADIAAKHQRKLAADWLKPNAFGTVNRDAAKAAFARAEEIKKNATAELNEAYDHLVRQLRDADASILIYHKRNDYHVVINLATAMLIVSERSLPTDSYRPVFGREEIAEMQRFLEQRNQWLDAAAEAEASEKFEAAIQLYGKARDDDSRRRCAMRFAVLLERRKLLGSAIEYYEMAGNYEKAAAIRQNASSALIKEFKVLNAEELHAKISSCCVVVSHGTSFGSGFFYKKGGFILTSRQTIHRARNIQVKCSDGKILPAQILTVSEQYDLAIIRVALEDHPVIGFRSDEVKTGLAVAWVDHFDKNQSAASMRRSHVSHVDRTFQNQPVYQLEGASELGQNGSAVVDQAGQLVGMLINGAKAGERDPGSFVIRSSVVKQFAGM